MRTEKEIAIDVNNAAHKALICNLVCCCVLLCLLILMVVVHRGLFLFANNSKATIADEEREGGREKGRDIR